MQTSPSQGRSPGRAAVGCATLVALAASCSVAGNLSAPEILRELDAIVRIDGSGADRTVKYAERATVSSWYARSLLLLPLRGPLVFVFGGRSEQPLESPAAHVRELLRELPYKLGEELVLAAQASVRLGWIAELETNAQSRVVAIDGLTQLAIDLQLPLFGGDFQRFGAPANPEQLAQARAGVNLGRPEVRTGDRWNATALRPYGEAVTQLAAAPLDNPIARLLLLEEVTQLRATENEPSMQPLVDAALRAAMGHVIEGALLRIVQGRAAEYVDLRLCAMEQVRRLGGPRAVPLLLAVMVASPVQHARGDSRYDSDPLVQLRLIHYCGQVRGEIAAAVVELPGRKDWQVQSPLDFLATTILNERAHYSKLRTPALVALTWSLQRPRLDPDPTWVRTWREGRP